MKKQYLVSAVMCSLLLVLSVGCHKPVSSTVVILNNSSFTTVMYAEKGGWLRFADIDATPFKITFPFGSPCAASSLSSPDGSEVKCLIINSEGTYLYQVVPYSSVLNGIPAQNNLAQVGNCPNCKSTGASNTGKPVSPGTTADHLAYIGCKDNTATEIPVAPSPFSANQTLEWNLLAPGDPNKIQFGATFNQKDSAGNPLQSPCQGGSYGPFYGSNMCTISTNASGHSYPYTVNRSDCTNPSPTYTMPVQ